MAEQEAEHRAIPETNSPTLGNGRYRLATKLGEGGMAVVYRAWDTHENEWRAIKVLLPEYAQRSKLRRRFANEAKTMLKLEHRHLVTVYDVGMNEALPFIVMEIADGGCVIDWIDAYGPMPPRMAVDVMMQVCKGVGAAHASGVVHRDIKPHNILITRRGICRVTDFGIAQVGEASSMTKTGSVMGTLGYMAPEQRTDAKHVDVRADVYGLGATLYKLVTGGSVADLFLAEHDTDLLEGVPAALVPIVLKATAYKPSQRYDTVTELAKALHRAKRELPGTPSDTPSLAMPPRVEGPTDLPQNELSEPTFLPNDLPEPRPSASESAPSLTPFEEDDGDPTTNTPLPYFMPAMEERTVRNPNDDDAIPDYIDQSAAVEDEGGYVVELDDATRKMSEEARKLAIKEGRIDEHGNPISDENVVTAPDSTGGLDFADNMGGMLGSILRALAGVLAKPVRYVLLVLFVAVVGFSIVLGGAAKEVRQAQSLAIDHRNALYATIEHESRIVEDVVALGGNRTQLSGMYFAFTDTFDEPDRNDAAMRFIGAIEDTMPSVRSSENASAKLHKLHMAQGRLEKVREARRLYLEAMIAWEEVADTPQGRAVIQFGVANQP